MYQPKSALVKLTLSSLLLLLILNNCYGEQRFLQTPASYQEVGTGEDIILPCRVDNKKGQCIWQKDRRPIGIHQDKYEWANIRSNSVSDTDCSLLIRKASLEFDDGDWECQVSPSDFKRQDSLTSQPARLVVKVKPRKPRIEYGGSVLTGALTLKEGQEVTVSCVSRYGNPPALIKWFIGGDEVEPMRVQTNATEVDSPKTWAAHSLLRVKGQREYHGKPIRCLSLHSSSPMPAIAEYRLDVHYSPEVRIETSPKLLTSALEDSTSFMSIKCLVDANPPATIKWYKDMSTLAKSNIVEAIGNTSETNSSPAGSEVRFEPVKREDAGLYSCRASNVIGESSNANYRLDVQYGPRLTMNGRLNETRSEVEAIALLGSTVEPFECDEFEANPPARYKWLHIRGPTSTPVDNAIEEKSSNGRALQLKNVIWSDEGEYRCVAYNIINGVRREMPAETKFLLHITGPPEIQTRPGDKLTDKGIFESIGWTGEAVHRLMARFCSRPPPAIVAWQWGSSHIRAGETIESKYEALPLEPITENSQLTNCYWAKLEIRNLQREDARIYTLLVESEKGQDSMSLKLTVRDPTEIKIIAIAVGVGLLLLFTVIGLAAYMILRIRSRRYSKERQDDEDEGSIAADAFYSTQNSISRSQKNSQPAPKVYSRKMHPDDGLSVMYDYNQINKHTRTMSPEALKVRRAPVVLQPPTIV